MEPKELKVKIFSCRDRFEKEEIEKEINEFLLSIKDGVVTNIVQSESVVNVAAGYSLTISIFYME